MILILSIFVVFVISELEINGVIIEDCPAMDPLGCFQKLRISLLLDGSLKDFDSSVTITSVDGIDGEEDIPLLQTLEINVVSDSPKLNYHLNFQNKVPYFATEEVIKVPNMDPGHQSCIDDPRSPFPTCGWVEHDGMQIPDSQGFCCNKPPDADPSVFWRGEIFLGEQSTPLNSFSTAHCLDFSTLMFAGYEIFDYSINSDIVVSMNQGPLNNVQFSVNFVKTFFLRNEVPEFKFAAEITNQIGEIDNFINPPDLSNDILYIPDSPSNDPRVESYEALIHAMMLIPRDEVGSECNEVGVSYHAFRSEKNFCDSSKIRDCIRNTLGDRHGEDVDRIIGYSHGPVQYIVVYLDEFNKDDCEVNLLVDGHDEKILEYSATIKDVEIEISIDLKDIELINIDDCEDENRDGFIDRVRASPAYIEGKSIIDIDIVNNGFCADKTNYTITLENCDVNGLDPIDSIFIDLDSGAGSQIVINATAEVFLPGNRCLACLGINGENVDQVLFRFDGNDYNGDTLKK